MTKELLGKPAKVILAVKILYLIVGLGIIRASITVLRHADVRSPDFLIFTKLLVYTASVFLIYQMSKARTGQDGRWS